MALILMFAFVVFLIIAFLYLLISRLFFKDHFDPFLLNRIDIGLAYLLSILILLSVVFILHRIIYGQF